MAIELANYSFLPWMRQGVSSQIKEADTYGANDGNVVERPELLVTLRLRQTDTGEDPLITETEITKNVRVLGPGDVIGMSNRAIVRTEPKAGVTNYEANSLVYIEFYEEEFIWRFTPASPASGGHKPNRLRPWVSLIVLKENEFTLKESKQDLPVITIDQNHKELVFHSEKELWAWGHVHINHKLKATTDSARTAEVTGTLDDDPDNGFSRLLCPRKLNKDTRYYAFLIPTFETGRLAGLGVDPAGVKAQTPAWKKGAIHENGEERPLEFPVYYSWKFNTGADGDFESLVAKLKPVIIKPELGKRPMDIQSPGFGMNQVAKSKTLGMEGALKPPGFVADAWPNLPKTSAGDDNLFIEKLRKVVNLSHELQGGNINPDTDKNPFFTANIGDDPIVTPPLYGQWHALQNHLPKTGGKPWFKTLNEDPRHRATAGLGTTSVQDHQEKLMHKAWLQIGEVNKANQKIREAQMSKKINMQLYRKHLTNGSNDRFIMKTSFVHSQLKVTGATLTHDINESRVPNAATSPAFQRLLRPIKKNKKLTKNHSVGIIRNSLITNFNKPSDAPLTAAKLKDAPVASVTLADATSSLNGVIETYKGDPKNAAKEVFFSILQPEVGATSVPNNSTLKTNAGLSLFSGLALTSEAKNLVHKLIDNITSKKIENGSAIIEIQGDVYSDFFGNTPEKRYSKVLLKSDAPGLTVEGVSPTFTLNDLTNLQSKFTVFSTVTEQQKFIVPKLKAPMQSVVQVGSTLKQKLNPAFTISNRALNSIKIFTVDAQTIAKPKVLKPIMAYPIFKNPAVNYLKKISQDYVMPNIDKVKENSITIVQTNQRFIEAYFAGLNHEMSRELLWRRYPTDQRGSYFRQFWDVTDDLLEQDEEKKRDIKPMHKWKKSLGQHHNRKASQGATTSDDGYLVLLIRGDVFKKYPNTMVYAQKARYNPADKTGPRILPNDLDKNVQYPLFTAELEPDVYLFGFDLTIDEARGHRGDTDPNTVTGPLNPGYFFCLRERPGQVRFGLDDFTDDFGNTNIMPPAGILDSWNDLSWEHTVNSKQQLQSHHLNFSKNITAQAAAEGTHPIWNANSADMAAILYQNPVLFARHAGEMLPLK